MTAELARMIRVNQAGEYGATRIYAGQMAVLGSNPTLQAMAEEEQQHLKAFNSLVLKYDVRPTFLSPLWWGLGYTLGAVTAMVGEKAAHACTIAVEEVIDEHYQRQLNALVKSAAASELHELIQRCRNDELAHKECAEQNGGRDSRFFTFLSTGVKAAVKSAIWLSERV